MKIKLFYVCILIIISAGLFYAGWYTHQTVPVLGNVDGSETARFTTIDSWTLKMLTNTSSTNRNFIFLDNATDNIVTTLSVGNINIESPSYRIVKGHTRDWLVVTRIQNSGTGYIDRFDDWYILGSSGNMKKVLSYSSQGHEVPTKEWENVYWKSDVANDYADDSAVDVTFTMKKCSTTEDNNDKDCTESSHVTHYVWNTDKEEFVASSI